jgi:histidinol-phosphate aminotransferase
MFNIENITRKNILQMKAYSSARSEFQGFANVFLDANENPNETLLNRYPDPLQKELKKEIGKLKGIGSSQIFLGNGSDEAIDLLFRAFCEPGVDKAFIFPPTYGMYSVSAAINNVEVIELSVENDFQLPSFDTIKDQLKSAGLLFICSPNNPTGNVISKKAIQNIADNFSGLVVVDEAYIDFSTEKSTLSLLNETPNLVVLQTFSKAWGMAGLRVGMAFASEEIISILNKIKPPYNINTLSQKEALKALTRSSVTEDQIESIKKEREKLSVELKQLDNVVQVFPSEANFILVEFENSEALFNTLIEKGIIVRNRSKLVKGCIRITVGTPEENTLLLNTLKEMQR